MYQQGRPRRREHCSNRARTQDHYAREVCVPKKQHGYRYPAAMTQPLELSSAHNAGVAYHTIPEEQCANKDINFSYLSQENLRILDSTHDSPSKHLGQGLLPWEQQSHSRSKVSPQSENVPPRCMPSRNVNDSKGSTQHTTQEEIYQIIDCLDCLQQQVHYMSTELTEFLSENNNKKKRLAELQKQIIHPDQNQRVTAGKKRKYNFVDSAHDPRLNKKRRTHLSG